MQILKALGFGLLLASSYSVASVIPNHEARQDGSLSKREWRNPDSPLNSFVRRGDEEDAKGSAKKYARSDSDAEEEVKKPYFQDANGKKHSMSKIGLVEYAKLHKTKAVGAIVKGGKVVGTQYEDGSRVFFKKGSKSG
ncbi:Uu.00g022390.m01.CDS01 [Anthostomella pinea]|uniref:Uu.00g022390.m01.CDS01 n=1 Tax=Anthostomella pinea TaxID=933095 RepID=A0AAI8YQZ7_9PEZI|nr:Uu.00g022390.m01.CDS01 [Anthostomella pinea]